MFKIYSKNFTGLATAGRDEQTIQTSSKITVSRISFSSIVDKVYLGLKVEDRDYFNPDLLNITTLKMDAGNHYVLPVPLVIEGKKTVSVKLLNLTGSTLNDFTVALHGDSDE